MRWINRTKKGAYIVEAVIVVPIFIMAVMMLISIIPIIATCENITYATVDELKLENVKAAFRKNQIALSTSLNYRIRTENDQVSMWNIDKLDYLYQAEDMEDLISLTSTSVFSQKNPLGLFSSVVYESQVISRAFTGKIHKEPPSAREDFEEEKEEQWVYIFPEWGKKYHGKKCTYIQSACQMNYLSQTTKRQYDPCKLCDAKTAEIGTPVFCFTNTGQVYHKAGCRIIDKYYIEMEKGDAVAKGYGACSKCGGK